MLVIIFIVLGCGILYIFINFIVGFVLLFRRRNSGVTGGTDVARNNAMWMEDEDLDMEVWDDDDDDYDDDGDLSDYDPFDNHWESSFDWKDEDNDGYDDRDDGFWNEREF